MQQATDFYRLKVRFTEKVLNGPYEKKNEPFWALVFLLNITIK